MSVALSIERAALVTEEAVAASPVLLSEVEQAYVSETATGLAFDADTPLEVWAPLVVRLYVAHKRIEFALADAIVFGERAYPDIYTQWVAETGLGKRTLQNYARVGRSVEPARRRADLSFSHHEAVASLPAVDQERLLGAAEHAGWTRYELRDAVRNDPEVARRRAEAMVGTEDEPAHVWVPTIDDLTDEMRDVLTAQAPVGKHRIGWLAGAVWALAWREERDAFTAWRA